MKTNKIGLLIPSLQSGGAERVLSTTSNLLSQAGYDVHLLLYDTADISYGYTGKLIDLKSKAGTNTISKILIRLMRIIKLSYYKYKYNFDTVISFLYAANVVNYYSIGRTNKVLACRGYSDYVQNGKMYSKMINNIHSFIVQTERMKNDFTIDLNAKASKINVLYNPFDVEYFQEKSKEEIEKYVQYFINTHKTICTVGSFKKDKGYWHLIKAFIMVRQSIKAGLIFIGCKGEMENEIRQMAETCGFKNDILFLGYKENPFKYISKCNLYVCSSIYEGFPNALVEAMACGTAVLSTDCKTGPREVLSDNYSNDQTTEEITFEKYGILVPNFNDEVDFNIHNIQNEEVLMSEGIIKILSDNELRNMYSIKAKKRAEQFGIKKYLSELIKIIDSNS
jgi:glycosyltransferase involved in cell wall biosynthesis